MTNQKPNFKRKQYYVMPKFQNHFMRVLMFLALLIFGGLIYPQYRIISSYVDRVQARELEAHGNLESNLGIGQLSTSEIQELALIRNSTFMYNTIFIFATCLIFGFYGSHRLGGPIYKTILYLRKYRNGEETSPLIFRKGDFFIELADEVNETLHNKKS
jgi:hypothetical protein